MDGLSLIIPAFIAGILTFLAPCTLPLVPGYLGFISGVSIKELQTSSSLQLRRKVLLNGIMYVVGFTVVFVLLGSLFGLGGSALAKHRVLLGQIGGVFVIVFGLYMMHVLRFDWLEKILGGEHRFNISRHITPGHPTSSFIFGATFAFGWTPCVGPILGTVLLLASTSGTLAQGALLLLVFSLGLALPFLAIAVGIGWATKYLSSIHTYLDKISIIGGLFLVLIGVLLVTDQFGYLVSAAYRVFEIIGYERLLQYL